VESIRDDERTTYVTGSVDVASESADDGSLHQHRSAASPDRFAGRDSRSLEIADFHGILIC
jgi:hypothetical protein